MFIITPIISNYTKLILSSFILLLVVLISGSAQANEYITGKVVGVSDGDTIKLLVSENEKKSVIKIRLAEIDAPEKNQPYGKKSKQALSHMIFGKAVTVRSIGKDRYKRIIGHIYIKDLWVNSEMVRTGNAWVYRKYSKSKALIDLESNAKKSKLGLWSLPKAERIPPWEWRRK